LSGNLEKLTPHQSNVSFMLITILDMINPFLRFDLNLFALGSFCVENHSSHSNSYHIRHGSRLSWLGA